MHIHLDLFISIEALEFLYYHTRVWPYERYNKHCRGSFICHSVIKQCVLYIFLYAYTHFQYKVICVEKTLLICLVTNYFISTTWSCLPDWFCSMFDLFFISDLCSKTVLLHITILTEQKLTV